MPRFRLSPIARKFLRRHPLWIGLLLCAHLLAGFPGSGPMLTAETGGYAVQSAPPSADRIRQMLIARAESERAKPKPTRTPGQIPDYGLWENEEITADPPADAPQEPSVSTVALPLIQSSPISETPPITDTAPPVVETVQPVARTLVWDGQPRTVRVPVLMYHYLSIPPDDADVYRRDLSVSPELFARQLDAIQAAGYTTISLYDLQANLWEGAPLPEKSVVITFDDAYRDNYTNAFPLLQERGMIATIFVVTDFMDEERPAYLTWDMAREMLAAGISIESHGRNHISLKNQSPDYLVWQALGSLETIQYELGVRPRFVSYPAGEFDDQTVAIFESANYWAGFTTIQGATHSTDDLFRLHRVRVRNTTEPEELVRLLGTDW